MDLILKPGMLIVRTNDTTIWKVVNRETEGVNVIDPLNESKQSFIYYGEDVLELNKFNQIFNKPIFNSGVLYYERSSQ